MATTKQASQALLFMRRCRQQHQQQRHLQAGLRVTRSASSDASQYAPSNFNKPLRQSTPSATPFSAPAKAEPESIWERPLQVRAPWQHRRAKSVAIPPAHVKSTFITYLKTLFGFRKPTPSSAAQPFHIHNNPYRARKSWPPNFDTLHPKQQFHFEKTYRRRAKLKWARPKWTRWTKLIQNTLLVTTVIYFVFILEPSHGEGTPFDGFRAWFFGKLKTLAGLSEESAVEVGRLEVEAREVGQKRKGWWQWLKDKYPG